MGTRRLGTCFTEWSGWRFAYSNANVVLSIPSVFHPLGCKTATSPKFSGPRTHLWRRKTIIFMIKMENQGKVNNWASQTRKESRCWVWDYMWASCPGSWAPPFTGTNPREEVRWFPGRQRFAPACPLQGLYLGAARTGLQLVRLRKGRGEKPLWVSRVGISHVIAHLLTGSQDLPPEKSFWLCPWTPEDRAELISLQTWVMLTYYS